MEQAVRSEMVAGEGEQAGARQRTHEGPTRRSFLSGTGGAALAVAASSLLSSRAIGQADEAPATAKTSEKGAVPAKTTAVKTVKALKYPHLLSPLTIGNHVLKNRMVATPGTSPHLIVSPEPYPNEAYMIHNANTARAGASIVVLSQPMAIHPTTEQDIFKTLAKRPSPVNPGHGTDEGHFTYWDMANTGCQNILSQLVEATHFYSSLCLFKADYWMPQGYDVSAGSGSEDRGPQGPSTHEEEKQGVQAMPGFGGPPQGPGGQQVAAAPGMMGGAHAPKKELTVEMLQKMIDTVVEQCVLGQDCGFDGVWIHGGYRGPVAARLLSPLTNHRTDQYGGSLENRARFTIELADAIKKRCGQDFFVMFMMSGVEPAGGYTLDDGAEFAKMFTGHIDLLDVKADGGSANAPDNFLTGADKYTPNLFMTEHYKKKGATIPLLSDGGFTELDWAEEAIASGKTDVVGMCRIFITNRDLIQLALEGRNEDVRPCIRCNFCHGPNYYSPWVSSCMVNPVWGIEHKVDRMISPPAARKRVAVIGGGPAGMEAALVATQRGHAVTLYEKAGALGGIFTTIENVSFKWPHKDFKDYMVRQVMKSGVKVRLNTEADPALIKRDGYDTVVVAIGAEPVVPGLPGIQGRNVVFAPDVYGRENALATDVVIVGGGETGAETAMHLSEKGHHVTVLEAGKVLAPDAMRVHFYQGLMESWQKHKNLKAILQARCTGIGENGVTYLDADGKPQSIEAGSVVVAVGMKARSRQAVGFYGASVELHRVGDCYLAGDLASTMRSAFGVATQI